MKKFTALLAAAVGMMAAVTVTAQEGVKPVSIYQAPVNVLQSAGNGRCRFVDLWSVRVNTVDFLATIPNIGAEVDLSRSPYNRVSFGVDARCRWNCRRTPTSYLLNVMAVKPELKYWWRGNSVSRIAWYGGLYADCLLYTSPSPRDAWYGGLYAEGGKYKYKFGRTRDGRNGYMYGAGISAGFARPLYQYRRAALDLEVGLSAGFLSTKYDAYDFEEGSYHVIQDKSEDWHVLPYPVASQLRVAFVLRSMSVNDKYRKVSERKLIRRQERRMKD